MKNTKLPFFNALSIFLLAMVSSSVVASVATVAGDEEPLPPDQAFVMSAKTLSADMIRAEWHIVDGYYMYRDKFRFDSNTNGISTNPGIYPKGKVKEDEFFGKVETYRGNIVIDIPITRTSDITTLDLTLTSQGCADIGICYPPQKQKVSLTLPPMPAGASAPAASEVASDSGISPISALKKLGDSIGLGSNEGEFLPPDQAFQFTAEVEDGNTIKASWNIADGYYLYRDKFELSLVDNDGITMGIVNMPPGKEKVDESFGKMVVYYHNVDLFLPLQRTVLEPTDVTVKVKYQGCADKGLCYPPTTKTMPLSLPAGQAMPTSTPASVSGKSAGDSGEQRSFIGNLLFAFGIGLLLSFTPCVLPLIPILVGVIVGQSGKQPSKMRSGVLSASYVMGTAVTYSIAGWLAGASGQQLQAYTQNVWGIGIVVLILVALALSMFGFYEIQMPSSIQSKLQTKSQNVKGGSMTGTFILGLVSALIVGACVTPLLMLVLGIAVQTGDPVLGASMMFSMAMGMGVILMMVGVGAGHLLPKAGAWMDIVKYVFGVLLIGVAIYLLTPLLFIPILLVWAVFFIVVGVYMGATQALPEGASKWRYMWKGLGTVLLIWGVLALIGGMQGNRDIMQPVQMTGIGGMMSSGSMASAAGGVTTVDPHDLFIQLKNTSQLDEELAKAKAAGKPVLLDYYAVRCTDCRRMEKATFGNPQVHDILQNKFVALQVDVTDPQNQETEAIKKRFKVFGPPAMLFFDKNGNTRNDLNFYGFKNPDAFIATLNELS